MFHPFVVRAVLGVALTALAASPVSGQPAESGHAGSSSDVPAIPIADSLATPPLPTWAEESVVTWDDVGSGEMLWRTEAGLVPLPVVDTEVEIRAAGVLVEGSIRQRFHNPTDRLIEAIYVFPLPERAAVQHMELVVGDRRIVAVIEERVEAKRTYERAKSSGKRAALVEQERPNLFTTSVANIQPGGTVDVVLEYVDETVYDDGAYSLTFPLTFTPRFIPEGVLTTSEATGLPAVHSAVVPDADRISPPFVRTDDPRVPRVRVRAWIDPGVPVSAVRCRSHEVKPLRDGDTWHVDTGEEPIPADRDVRLSWRPDVDGPPEVALLTELRNDQLHALLMLVPPELEALARGEGLPTETVFVLDVSGSMQGPSIEQARAALLAALARLEVRDRFAIAVFSNETRVFRSDLLPARATYVRDASAWVRALRADGGTNMFPALVRATTFFTGDADAPRGDDPPSEAGAPTSTEAGEMRPVRRIVLLTDGAIGNESGMLDLAAGMRDDVHLHVVGIGYAPNRHLVRQLAVEGRGLCAFLASAREAENEIDRFLARIARPVLRDVRVDWPDAGVVEAYPSMLPELHAGEPLVVSARLDAHLVGRDARMVVRARTDVGDFERVISLDDAATADGAAVRWARHRVESLEGRQRRGADADSVRQAIVEVGLAYHLVTAYTSLVAVEEAITADGTPDPVRLANALPVGSQLLGPASHGHLPRGGNDGSRRGDVLAFLIRSAILLLVARALLGDRRESA